MKHVLEKLHCTPISLTFNEAMLLGALCLMTAIAVFLGSRAITLQGALDTSLQNRIILGIPATDRTNINLIRAYEKNH